MNIHGRSTTARVAALAAATAAVSLCAAGTASAAIATGPSGDSFYTPASSKYKSGKPGDVIWQRTAQSGMTLSNAAKSITVVYKSKSLKNKLIPVSGTVWIPKGTAPTGGWPVISWGHGTTGVADACAPSKNTDTTSNGYTGYVKPEINDWLANGYAVAMTDFEGLGTVGPHPWLLGPSEGRGMIDIVRAAKKLDSKVSTKWISTGHSQGGHAALFAASLASTSYGAGLTLKGVVPFAPANNMKSTAQFAASAISGPNGITGLGALLAQTINLADPTLKLTSFVTPEALAHIGDLETRCLGNAIGSGLSATDSFGQLSPRQLLKGWDNSKTDWTDANSVKALNTLEGPLVSDSNLLISAPVLILQGTADGTVIPGLTDKLVKKLGVANGDWTAGSNGVYSKTCTTACRVTYKTYEGVDHGGVVAAGETDATAFINARFGR